MLRIDLVTIFPEYFDVLGVSLLGKARAAELVETHVHDLRSWTTDVHHTVDDSPFGGGAGMVMKADVWGLALDEVLDRGGAPHHPDARGRAVHPGHGRGARARGAARVRVRALRGHRRAGRGALRRAAPRQRDLARRLRAQRGRGGRPRDDRGRHAAPSGLRRQRREPRRGEPRRRPARVPELHPPGVVAGPRGARGAAQRQPRRDRGLAARGGRAAHPPAAPGPAAARRRAGGARRTGVAQWCVGVRAVHLRHRGGHIGVGAHSGIFAARQISRATCGGCEEIDHGQARRTSPQLSSRPTFPTSVRATPSRFTSRSSRATARASRCSRASCIARKGNGIGETFMVRKISFGVGVERTFPLHSPTIDKIELERRGDVRRAKLYYLRNLRGKAARIREKRDRLAADGARDRECQGRRSGEAAPPTSRASRVDVDQGTPHRRRVRARAVVPPQDVLRPVVLDPVVVDGVHARRRRPHPRHASGVRGRWTFATATSSCSSTPTTGCRPKSVKAGSGPQGVLGDVLRFMGLLPEDAGEHLVKRVIGLPGDVVECRTRDGPVYVNGVAIVEPYVAPGVAPCAGYPHARGRSGSRGLRLGDGGQPRRTARTRAPPGRPGRRRDPHRTSLAPRSSPSGRSTTGAALATPSRGVPAAGSAD